MTNSVDFISDLWKAFVPIDEGYCSDDARPLAHYTSLANLEKILRSRQLWLSHPYLMNDFQELQHGLLVARQCIQENSKINTENHNDACFIKAVQIVLDLIDYFTEKKQLDQGQLLNRYRNMGFDHTNIYVFCFCDHTRKRLDEDSDNSDSAYADNDGLLSMWRTYGSLGGGAALVFNEKFIEIPQSKPLKLHKIKYSYINQRKHDINIYIEDWCRRVTSRRYEYGITQLTDNDIQECAHALFTKLLLIAATTKYKAFDQEYEWRLLAMPDKELTDYYDYHIGPIGIEPKLKYPIDDIAKYIDRIILGPTLASTLAVKSTCRLLDRLGLGELKEKVVLSQIPLRPGR